MYLSPNRLPIDRGVHIGTFPNTVLLIMEWYWLTRTNLLGWETKGFDAATQEDVDRKGDDDRCVYFFPLLVLISYLHDRKGITDNESAQKTIGQTVPVLVNTSARVHQITNQTHGAELMKTQSAIYKCQALFRRACAACRPISYDAKCRRRGSAKLIGARADTHIKMKPTSLYPAHSE